MFKAFGLVILTTIVLSIAIFSLPSILTLTIQYDGRQNLSLRSGQFPVTVDPKNKVIIEDEEINAFLESEYSPLQAAAASPFRNVFEWIATSVAKAAWYQNIAAVNGHFVVVASGMRKEQAAKAFADALAWNDKEKQVFMTPKENAPLPLPEGSFSPGIYFVGTGTTPEAAQTLINNRFSKEVLSRYGTSTAEIVPLNQALTIASLIQREAGGKDDMRLISGVIWNRIFAGANLQIDATLQYAKANNSAKGSWWPAVVPADKFRKSSYNTYMHKGLPPTPIANPSVAAIVAALNPTKTSCLFYFHDEAGEIHCSDTYPEHVSLLKQYYGQGK